MRRTKLSDNQRQEILVRHRRGEKQHDLAVEFGCDHDTIRRIVDPVWRQKRIEQVRSARASYARGSKEVDASASYRPVPEVVAQRIAEIPRFDTRSLTGRIFGDPEPTDTRRRHA